MKAINEIPINVRAVGITMTLAALVITLLAMAMTASPTMAQTPTPTPTSTPEPCGPGALKTPGTPDATITQGHYGVFEGYWDSKSETLNLNLCPPAVEHRDVPNPNPREGGTIEVSTRHESNIDIRRTVFHIDHVDGVAVDEQFKHTLTAAEVEKYDFLKVGDGPDAGTVDDAVGTTVWWLKVDDESTSEDEDSPLAMGFSAALFESQHWYREEGSVEVEPLQYEFEVIREPGIPVAEQGHVFAFDDSAPPADEDKTAYWDSSEVDANALPLNPGDYHHFQWIFTKPGTYEISVQLKGHVRQDNPHGPTDKDYDSTWERISDDDVVTSEVERYTFQIGPLALNEDPAFVVERSVDEHSAIGTTVGDPIPVYQGDDDDLTFTLSGLGHSVFSVEADDNGNAQIKVADSRHLDHEDRPEYRLTLSVSDNKDREGNANTAADSAISVKINVANVAGERSVDENSPGGALVDDVIVVANATTSTTYTLAGDGSDLFTVENSGGDAQIKVADGAVINYEDAQSYELTLRADTAGTEDAQVVIKVLDDPDERISLIMTDNATGTTLTTGSTVIFTGRVTNSPVATSALSYEGHAESPGDEKVVNTVLSSPSWSVSESDPGTRKYWMYVSYTSGEYGLATSQNSNVIVFDWQKP